MRISDWSSDVCSSDLHGKRTLEPLRKGPANIGRRDKIQLAIAHTFPLNHPAVIGPLQQSLALARTAKRIARLAILADLAAVPRKGPPALDLSAIIGVAAPHEIAAIPQIGRAHV